MFKSKFKRCGTIAFALLAGCSSQGSNLPVTSIDPITSSTLQFAVGTFNRDGGQCAGNTTTLNIAASLRNSAGHSAVLTDSVTVFGPPNFSVGGNPGVNDGGAPNQILNSFGGQPLFGDGFGQAGVLLNANNNVSGLNGVQNFAGPPAWPEFNNGVFPPGFIGYPEGMWNNGMPTAAGNSCGDLTPLVGTYEMDVTIPTGVSTSDVLKATAALTSTVPLPKINTPTFVTDNNGGGTVTVDVPPGLSETFVNLSISNQACFPVQALNTGNGSTFPPTSVYTLMTRTAGTVQTMVLPDNLGPPGPGGARLHTICTAADNANFHLLNQQPGSGQIRLSAVGVDYPAYEASYPQSTTPTPILVGPNGQADVTQSLPSLTFSE